MEHVQYSCLVAIDFVSRSLHFLLLGTLVFLIKVGLADLRLHFVDRSDCDICFVHHAVQCERYQSVRCGEGIVQKHLTNQCLPGIFCIPHRSPIDPRCSCRFYYLFLWLLAEHLLLCDDASATSLVHAWNLSNSGEMHGRKACIISLLCLIKFPHAQKSFLQIQSVRMIGIVFWISSVQLVPRYPSR